MRTFFARLPIAAALVSACLVIVAPVPQAVAAPQKVWGYSDPAGDQKPAVDVVETKLDIKMRGFYRIRVFGAEFQKNETDMVRLFFDTDPEDSGPDYFYDWHFGRSPARKVGYSYFGTTDSWRVSGERVKCPRIRRGINYRTDVITVAVPKSCLSKPEEVRWAGFTGRIARVDKQGTMWGEWDDFPKVTSFPGQWVA
jgi:hypothetical protein